MKEEDHTPVKELFLALQEVHHHGHRAAGRLERDLLYSDYLYADVYISAVYGNLVLERVHRQHVSYRDQPAAFALSWACLIDKVGRRRCLIVGCPSGSYLVLSGVLHFDSSRPTPS